jgi:hypothetical protein
MRGVEDEREHSLEATGKICAGGFGDLQEPPFVRDRGHGTLGSSELQNLMKRLEGKEKEVEWKKAVYFDAIESGELSLDLVSEKLEQIKTEGEKNRKVILET